MTKSAAFRTWTNRLDDLATGSTWTHSQINAFRLAYVVAYGGNAGRSTMTQEESEILITRYEALGPVRISAEHQAKGLGYLERSKAKLKREGFPIDDVLESFDHFTWSGYDFHDGPYIDTGNFHAVWRIHLTNGAEIAYSMAPWQSGGYFDWRWIKRPALV